MAKVDIVRLNADIPRDLKLRLKVYCVKEEMEIKQFVILALETMLDEMEGDPT